jgi:hypothetical protein
MFFTDDVKGDYERNRLRVSLSKCHFGNRQLGKDPGGASRAGGNNTGFQDFSEDDGAQASDRR